MTNITNVNDILFGPGQPLVLIAGPCVIEDAALTRDIAAQLKEKAAAAGLPLIFKASYDKANRTAIDAYRGPGRKNGLAILADIKAELGVPIISDVHSVAEVPAAAEVLDVLQIPAFLCRQTDLILATARAGQWINIKKGQFLAPWDMANVVAKARSLGQRQILLTERGASFGYNNLVVDFRGIGIMQQTGCPVIFDATHSVQLPGGAGSSSGGQREFAPVLARAAVATGADGIFMEVHPDPDRALCDGPNSLRLDTIDPILRQLAAIRAVV
jgi:2-dehydro-3-deoxyphosphooctonate aldolase (KDO 8-P synthase)